MLIFCWVIETLNSALLYKSKGMLGMHNTSWKGQFCNFQDFFYFLGFLAGNLNLFFFFRSVSPWNVLGSLSDVSCQQCYWTPCGTLPFVYIFCLRFQNAFSNVFGSVLKFAKKCFMTRKKYVWQIISLEVSKNASTLTNSFAVLPLQISRASIA